MFLYIYTPGFYHCVGLTFPQLIMHGYQNTTNWPVTHRHGNISVIIWLLACFVDCGDPFPAHVGGPPVWNTTCSCTKSQVQLMGMMALIPEFEARVVLQTSCTSTEKGHINNKKPRGHKIISEYICNNSNVSWKSDWRSAFYSCPFSPIMPYAEKSGDLI